MVKIILGFVSNLRNNVFLADFFDSISSGLLIKRFVLANFVRKINKIDSINDFDLFKKKIGQLLKHNYSRYTYNGRYEHLEYYGYYSELLKYSGYGNNRYPILTGIEHGVRFGNTRWQYYGFDTCYLCQGKNRIYEINEQEQSVPVVAIGPYIYYASQYYDEETINSIRTKNGKTLLVFLGHTTEWEMDKQESDIVNIVYEKYGKKFDTIMVCVYWRDVFGIEIERFREKGAHIVSAGFRQDPNFIRRLKTIIALSDFIIADDIGTNIGYALCMGKTFALEGICKDYEYDLILKKNFELFQKAFTLDKDNNFSEEQKILQKSLYDGFWSPDEIKTKEEICFLFYSFDKMLKHSCYNPFLLHRMIKDNKIFNILDENEINELNRIMGTNIFEIKS